MRKAKKYLILKGLMIILFIGLVKGISAKSLESYQVKNVRLLGHADPATELLVSYYKKNDDFIKSLAKILNEINLNHPDHKILLRVLNLTIEDMEGLWPNEKERSCVIEPMDEKNIAEPWMRDFCKLAIADIEKEGKTQEKLLIIDTNRGCKSEGLPTIMTKYWYNSEVLKVGDKSSEGGDFGGNIDITPNGVLYMGTNASQNMRDFWNTKGKDYKGHTVFLDNHWLDVGHVDEQISVINRKDLACPMAIIKADPSLAITILSESKGGRLRKDFPDRFKKTFMYNKLTDLHHYILSHKKSLMEERRNKLLMSYPSESLENNMSGIYDPRVQFKQQFILTKIIDNNARILKDKIIEKSPECKNIEIISLPVLFDCNGGKQSPIDCTSLLPNSLNMIVLGQDLIIANPLYKAFGKYIDIKLKESEQTPHFILDLFYQDNGGGVHCATNELRMPLR